MFADVVLVGPDYGAGADIEWSGFEFGVEAGRKDNGMAAASFEDGKNDGRARFMEASDQVANQAGADQRMIDQTEQNAIGGWR